MSAGSQLFRGSLAQPMLRSGAVHADPVTRSRHQNVHDGRLYALDLARFVAMLWMMQGHVLDALVSTDALNPVEFPWNVWHWVRGLTAPVFLMVSGAAHVFASKRHSTGQIREDILAKRVRWAITIVGLGYLMVFPASRIWDLPFVPSAGWQQFLAVNILQLTGLSLLVFVLVMASTNSVRSMGIRAVGALTAILALTPIMHSTAVMQTVPNWLAPYLTSDTGSLFPFFPFGAYLFAGVAVGVYLRETPPEHRDSQLKAHGIRIGALIAGSAFLLHLYLESQGVPATALDSADSVLLVVRRIGFVLMILSAAVAFYERTPQLRNWYVLFGTRSLYIYVIHLILLYGSPWWSGLGRTANKEFSLTGGIVAMLSIMVSTLFLAWGIDRYERSSLRPEIKATMRVGSVMVLVYLLCF